MIKLYFMGTHSMYSRKNMTLKLQQLYNVDNIIVLCFVKKALFKRIKIGLMFSYYIIRKNRFKLVLNPCAQRNVQAVNFGRNQKWNKLICCISYNAKIIVQKLQVGFITLRLLKSHNALFCVVVPFKRKKFTMYVHSKK